VNGDAKVNLKDVARVVKLILTHRYDPYADLDRDGDVDFRDLLIVVRNLGCDAA
jgi:hypothetical protein